MNLPIRALCLVVLMSIAPSAALATTFNMLYASPHAPLAVWNKMAKEFYFVEVNKRLQPLGHRINWTDSYGGTIVKFGSEVDSLQKGLADMSMAGAIFNQSRLPLHLASYAAPFATTNLKVAVETMDEVTANNAALKKMWDDAGVVHLASIGIEALHLYTKMPITGMKDLQGVKIGGVGINMAWLRNSGVIPVVNTPDKVYNDIQTGVIEGQFYLPTLTFVGKVNEVAPYMLDVGFGVAVWGSLAVSKKTWNTLPADVQKVMREVAIEYRVKTADGLNALAATGIETMKKAGMKITEISVADRQAWANALPDLSREWVQPLEAKGMPAKQVLNDYLAGLRKRGEKPLRDWEIK